MKEDTGKIGKETQGIDEDRDEPRREVCGKTYEEGKLRGIKNTKSEI
jgi:hypothetical protein